jgi:hypothetical protein
MEVMQLRWCARRWGMAVVCMLCMLVSGCIGTVVGTAVDVTLALAKVPFKAAGAVIDVTTSENKDKE